MGFRWGSNVLLLAAGVLLGTNLVFLWEIRGDDVTGWELVGPAEAVLNYVHGGVVHALRVHLDYSRHYQFYSGMSSVFFSLVPGWLHLHVVWLLWAPFVALALTIAFFGVFLASLQLDVAIFMLGWAASGALMTLSIMGVPHVAAVFPFCVGIPAILLRANASATFFSLGLDAIIWAAVWELTLHCYEPGRSVAVVPLIAAVTLPAVAARRRAVWVLCTVVMLWAYSRFVSLSFDYPVLVADLPATIRQLPTAGGLLWGALFHRWRLDYPFMVVLAVFGLVVMRTHKLFWTAVLCLALTLVFLLAVVGLLQHLPGNDMLRARRFGVVAFLAAAVVARAWDDRDRLYFRQIACAGLLGASLFALYQTYRFDTGTPSTKSLPFTESIADLHVDRKLDMDAARLAGYASGSLEQHFILYGYTTYAENNTDPKCFPERVLLQMEPEKFLERIRFIDGEVPLSSRYSSVPMYATSLLLKTMEDGTKPFYLHLHREPLHNDVHYLQPDGSVVRASWLADMLRNADAEPVDLGLQKFTSFHVQPRTKPVQAAGVVAR